MRIIRQVLLMIKEEKLFSAIHIAGTAMAIAFTMVMAVVYYIKLAPIYPEVNRPRTVYFEGLRVVAENGGQGQMPFGAKAFEEWFQNSKNIEFCAPTLLACGSGKRLGRCSDYASVGNDDFIEVTFNLTNADFFKIYQYNYISGRPFTEKEVEDQEKVCVISDEFSNRLFGKNTDAIGQMVRLESGKEMRVVGVVQGGSQLTPDSYADLFMPYTLVVEKSFTTYGGMFSVVATVKDSKQLQELRKELDELSARLSVNILETTSGIFSFGEGVKTRVDLSHDLETHPMHALRTATSEDSFKETSNRQVILHFAALLFILLFVPALNLCGIVAGRMERRTAEMGVRKTFGARRSTLLGQVISENLVLTTIGGIIGLTAAWVAIYGMRTEILGMFFASTTLNVAPLVTDEMLFAPLLFVSAFVAILLMNLLSAL
nr:ABC transporter permease [Bacteroidaceae bacterium]